MRIALGVSGGIAAYKACEIVRGLTKAGAEVEVVLTRNATRFVTPLTLETLSGTKAHLDLFDGDDPAAIRHIELARSVDALVVAPATANVLAKLARGIADDLLSTFALAVTGPVVVAPAMNTRMLQHASVQESLNVLRGRGVRVVDPESGWLAERETGWGRLADPARIVAAAIDAARRSSQLVGKKVVVTAGPTREPIDPVRFVSNRSSGKMGYALAAALARRGAAVVLVSGPVDLPVPYGVERIPVETSREMRSALLAQAAGAHAIFMVAAVSDYLPRESSTKIKKDGGVLTLTLDEGPDILAELGSRKDGAVLVGFAAETQDLLEGAGKKLAAKNLDWIVANDVSLPGLGIGADRNQVTILGRAGSRLDVPAASKAEVAESILDRVFGESAS